MPAFKSPPLRASASPARCCSRSSPRLPCPAFPALYSHLSRFVPSAPLNFWVSLPFFLFYHVCFFPPRSHCPPLAIIGWLFPLRRPALAPSVSAFLTPVALLFRHSLAIYSCFSCCAHGPVLLFCCSYGPAFPAVAPLLRRIRLVCNAPGQASCASAPRLHTTTPSRSDVSVRCPLPATTSRFLYRPPRGSPPLPREPPRSSAFPRLSDAAPPFRPSLFPTSDCPFLSWMSGLFSPRTSPRLVFALGSCFPLLPVRPQGWRCLCLCSPAPLSHSTPCGFFIVRALAL